MVTLGALLFPAYLLAPLSSSLSLFPLPTFLKQDKDIVCIFFRRKEGCHLLRANVTPLSPSSSPFLPHWGLRIRGTVSQNFFILLMNMQWELLYWQDAFPSSLSLHFPLLCFSECALGERGQPHPSAEWHSMKREGKKTLPGPSPNEQINASVSQESERGALAGPEGPGQNTRALAVAACSEWTSFWT